MAQSKSKMAVKEKRILYAATAGTLLGSLFMFISTCTDHWVQLSIPSGVYRNTTNSYLIGHNSGLWRICRKFVDNVENPTEYSTSCLLHKFYPSSDEVVHDPEVDQEILNYNRAETAFSVISLVLAFIGHIFGIYSLNEPRYMFKRLAAVLFLMTAATILVAAEVLISSVTYERSHLPARHPPDAALTYGFSFGLAWVAFAAFLIGALVFAVLSRKRKGDKAIDEYEARENEPVQLGRN